MPSLMIRVADSMRTDGYMPANNAELARSVKAKLAGILSSPKAPPLDDKPIPRASVHASIWVSASESSRLEALAGNTGMSTGETASALLLRDFDEWTSAQKAPPPEIQSSGQESALHRALARNGGSPREEQVSMLMALRKLDAGAAPKVLFCEAGTGTGKTLAYLGYVIDSLQSNPAARAMVAAPSFGLLEQIGLALASFKDEAPAAAFLAGQSEWISRSALRDMLDDRGYSLPPAQEAQLRDWLNTGGDGQRPAWSLASLLEAAPGFPFADDVTVVDRSDDEDPGWIAYENQFKIAATARLVVLTHAMLANLTKRRLFAQSRALRGNENFQMAIADWKALSADQRDQRFHEMMNAAMSQEDSDAGCDRLPNVDLLVIDEAHSIEDAFANAFGQYISLRSLVHLAQHLHKENPGVFRPDSITALQQIEADLRRFDHGPDEVVSISDSGVLARINQALEAAIKPRNGAPKAAAALALRTRTGMRLSSLFRICDLIVKSSNFGQAGMVGYMHWSPMRDYPRLSLGKMNLSREMHYVWTVVAQRTALVSGTLYEEIPRPSCETLRRTLAVPFDATVTMAPIHARWQIEPVTLMIAAEASTASGRPRLFRPSSSLPEAMRNPLRDAWLDDVADYVLEAYKSAAGGLLVLGTAFADISGIESRLSAHNLPLIAQRPGARMDGLRTQFLKSARSSRPILLAVGAAWTGFDLHDQDNKNALTDLVIINAPLGVYNRTVAKLRRAAQGANYFELSAQALILVRQAVGRLVRSPETPKNRRIHWLDARIHDPKRKGLYAPIVRFLSRYRSIPVT